MLFTLVPLVSTPAYAEGGMYPIYTYVTGEGSVTASVDGIITGSLDRDGMSRKEFYRHILAGLELGEIYE